ncbi:ribonuclease toxin immunity protein CdiI [Lysinibacillus sp. CNPSo 3705]|uniref:ribonuclease toxin immunity protein CdiI n=1 Tax=Lysinibacillus sp. CNPSo 3705 TaxID=3028148 RepID=UPI00236438D4|nr:ribonuclease toxin immunity protein CdiI [Lysinibacillus sp. CNPSo 3705]MDD1505703.1 ribonuclease toxin immunity protein CdiI [Lysinibacillus sp. CNPSo 3705]
MDDEIYYVKDTQEKIENMEAYYRTLGNGYFLEALNEFKNGKGFGIGYTSCYFATECTPNDEEYFGDTGVNFTTTPPVTSTEVYSIVDYEMFFEYLLKVAQEYLSIYPQNKLIVVENLTQIQKRFGIEIKK